MNNKNERFSIKHSFYHNRLLKNIVLAICCIFLSVQVNAQNVFINDSSIITYSPENGTDKEVKIGYKTFILPAVFIGYGALALQNNTLNRLNVSIKNEISDKYPAFHSNLDNLLPVVPAATVFGLQAMGIRGKNSWKNEAIIYATAIGISLSFVMPVKYLTHSERPDGSNFHSFPSGHTTIAFASAEFLRREYQCVSPWIGVAGYAVATSTGALRMLNNKHWFSDVVAGAGVGIAATTLSYIIYEHFFERKNMSFTVIPVYSDGAIGFSLVSVF